MNATIEELRRTIRNIEIEMTRCYHDDSYEWPTLWARLNERKKELAALEQRQQEES